MQDVQREGPVQLLPTLGFAEAPSRINVVSVEPPKKKKNLEKVGGKNVQGFGK